MLPSKGFSLLTITAIFSRRKRNCSKPFDFSSGVKPRLIAAISILPFNKFVIACCAPFAAISTFEPGNFFSKPCFKAWLIAATLLEPSIRILVSLGILSGKGKEAFFDLEEDSAKTDSES